MADEASVTLEELEREAEEALKAEEVQASTDSEEVDEADKPEAEESEEAAEHDDSGAAQGAQVGKKGGKTVTIPSAKLHELRKERKEARERETTLARQNEELRQQLSLMGNQKAGDAPMQMPTLESVNYDEAKYQEKMAEWQSSFFDRRLAEHQQREAQAEHQRKFHAQIEDAVTAHYQRVSALGVGDEDFIPAERTMRDTFGDAAVDHMISAIGEGSEKVVLHLGLNQEEREKVEAILRRDPSGLAAMSYCGRLAEKLNTTPAQRQVSQAPAADRPLAGSVSSGGSSSIVKRLAQLDRLPNRDAFSAYKKQLIAAGQTELLRKHGYL